MTYNSFMENHPPYDALTYTFDRSDWELIRDALKATSAQCIDDAFEIGESTDTRADLLTRSQYMQALASDIELYL